MSSKEPCVKPIETHFGPMEIRRLSYKAVKAMQPDIKKDGEKVDEDSAARALVKACVVDRALDDATLAEWEEEHGFGWADLVTQVSEHNGLTAAAQRAAKRTFRPGDGQPGEAPAGS